MTVPILNFGNIDGPQTHTDEQVWQKACSAANAAKFRSLCNAEYYRRDQNSIDAAAMALLTFFAFYSPNDEQCIRMFKQTRMYQEPKLDFLSQQLGQMQDRWIYSTMRKVRELINEQRAQEARNKVIQDASPLSKAMRAKAQAARDKAAINEAFKATAQKLADNFIRNNRT